jgi:hypothetical protein
MLRVEKNDGVSQPSNDVQTVPMDSLRHHLVNNDFSRWASEVP